MRTTRGTNPEREAVKEYLQQYHDAKAKSRYWRSATAPFPPTFEIRA